MARDIELWHRENGLPGELRADPGELRADAGGLLNAMLAGTTLAARRLALGLSVAVKYNRSGKPSKSKKRYPCPVPNCPVPNQAGKHGHANMQAHFKKHHAEGDNRDRLAKELHTLFERLKQCAHQGVLICPLGGCSQDLKGLEDLQGHFWHDGASEEHAKTLSLLVVGSQKPAPPDGLSNVSSPAVPSVSQLPTSQTGSAFGFSVPEAQLQNPIQYGMPLHVGSAAYTIGLDRPGFVNSSWQLSHDPFLNCSGFGDVSTQQSNTPVQRPDSGLGSPFTQSLSQYNPGPYGGGFLHSAAPPNLLWAPQPQLGMQGNEWHRQANQRNAPGCSG
jgi:hypothetical protein